MIHLDFETFSTVDLQSSGVSKYARHISTDVACLAWALDDHPIQIWQPGEPCPPALREAVKRGAKMYAHNAGFEKHIWDHVMVPYYRWPKATPEQWNCTAAQAAYVNLPRSLDSSSKAIGLPHEKDDLGRRTMLWLCKPQDGKRRYEAHRLELLQRYCQQDVNVERELHRALPPLPNDEQEIWLADRTINERGVPADMDLCRGAVVLLRDHTGKVDLRLRELTDGYVTRVTQRERILDVLQDYEPLLPDVTQETLEEWKFADPIAAEIAALRASAGLASIKKFKATLDWADEDGRCRNLHKHYGAGTGRWSGSGPQFQNMKRSQPPSDEILEAIARADYPAVLAASQNGDVCGLLSTAVRAIVCASPGNTLVQSDFANIEGRVLAWLAGEERVLEQYAQGVDLYKVMATHIYNVDYDSVTKDQRQVAKIAVLGLGYGCGALSFYRMARKNGADVDLAFAQNVVDVYRSVNQRIVSLWRDLEKAAVLCVKTGRPVAHRFLVFAIEGNWLTIRLPSNRKLYYYKPGVAPSKFGSISFWYHSSRGLRINCYGGMITENVVQAMSRCILANAILKLEKSGLPVILHVHDSVIVETSAKNSLRTENKVHAIMAHGAPEWARGCPITAETITARRMK